jgi:hypothetical protein
MKKILLLVLIGFFVSSNLFSQINFSKGFKLLKSGKLNESVMEFEKIIYRDSLSKKDSIIPDTLFRYAAGNPKDKDVKYILGILCEKMKFKYDSYLFLEDFLMNTKNETCKKKAKNILDTMKIEKEDLEYCRFIKKYIAAVKIQTEELSGYWDKKTIDRFRKECDIYIKQYKNSDLNSFIPIGKITTKPEYKNIQVGNFGYSMVKDSAGIKLIHPVLIMTKNWAKKESRHFIFYCRDQYYLPEYKTVNEMDKYFEEITEKLKIKDTGKIQYYLCYQPETCGELFSRIPDESYVYPQFRILASTDWFDRRGMVRVLNDNLPDIPLLAEGLVYSYGGTYSFGREFILPWVKDLALVNKIPKISQIYLKKNFDTKNTDNYFTAGAFSKFLVEVYGIDKYLGLEKQSVKDLIFPEKVKEIYNLDLITLENDFISWLKNSNIPSISAEFKKDAEEIFSMDDPENDDNGAGSFTYPKDNKCKPGIFDLTKFRVLKDNNRIYFELKFRNLTDNDSVDWGFYKNYAVIKITNNQNDRWSAYAKGNVEVGCSTDYWFYISDRGIRFENNNNQYVMMKILRTDENKFGDIKTKCIRFSIPCSLAPKINKNTGYFVGIGAGENLNGKEKNARVGIGGIVKIDSLADKIHGGGGSSGKYSPDLYDILLPDSLDQHKLLSNYSNEKGKRAMLPSMLKDGPLYLFSPLWTRMYQKEKYDSLVLNTKNWFIKETPNYVFHFEEEKDKPDSIQINILEKFYNYLSRELKTGNIGRINYFLTKSDNILSKLFTDSYAWMGLTYFNTIIAGIWDIPHEVVHLFDYKLSDTYVPVLSEGIATCLDGKAYVEGTCALERFKGMMLKKQNAPVSKIYLAGDFQGGNYDEDRLYRSSGAFVHFLIDKYGMEKYVELRKKTVADSLFPVIIKQIFGKDLAAFEEEFNDFIINGGYKNISTDFNENAEVIFSMDDPENDDYGNGNYIYPLDTNCKPGIFDLTKFRVLKDEKKVYFELKFRKLADHDSLDWGLYRTNTTILVKTNRTDTQRTTGWGAIDMEGKFEYIIRICDKGAELLYPNLPRIPLQKLYRNNNEKFGNSKNGTIRFSIPVEFVSKIDKNCGYFVGTGATDISNGIKKTDGWGIGGRSKIDSIATFNNGGGGTKTEYNANLFDILLPKEIDQKKLLNDYSIENKKRALIPYVYMK